MNTKRIVSFFTLTLALPLLLLATPNAKAYDLKQWSGSLCQAFFGAQEQYFDKTWAGIKNTSTVPRWVSCGVVDDTYNGTATGNYILGAEGAFVYFTQSFSSTSTCLLSERGFVGQEIDTKTGVKTGTGFVSVTTSQSDRGGNRVLACKLAAGATLTWIRIWEYDSSDTNH